MISMENVILFSQTSETWKFLFSNQNNWFTEFVVNCFSCFTDSIVIGQSFNLLKKFVGCFLKEKNINFMLINEVDDLICFLFLLEEAFRKKFTLLFFILFSTHIHCMNIIEVVYRFQQCFVADEIESSTVYYMLFQLLQFFLFWQLFFCFIGF